VGGAPARIITVALTSDQDQEHESRQVQKKVTAGCPNGVPSRVVGVLALRADGKTTKPQEKKDAEISIYPTE